MNKTNVLYFLIILMSLSLLNSCVMKDPNTDDLGNNVMESHLRYTDMSIQNYQDTVYVPVYSEIYSERKSKSILLTATLSIRSTSYVDTTYINAIEYFDTQGNKLTSYHDKTLVLGPMESIEYVIDREDVRGGTGANFMIRWGATHDVKPMFQCVMISTSGQHGISFTTEGISIKK